MFVIDLASESKANTPVGTRHREVRSGAGATYRELERKEILKKGRVQNTPDVEESMQGPGRNEWVLLHSTRTVVAEQEQQRPTRPSARHRQRFGARAPITLF